MYEGFFDINEELKKLPSSPGVYIMHDSMDEIIYVGKAISLKTVLNNIFSHPEITAQRYARWSLMYRDLNILSQIQSLKRLCLNAI